jgi:two-component system sensor histidine kinase VicK
MENIAPEKNEEYVKSIYDEALRMNGIVTSLLSFSRLTQMTAIEKESCNLSELLRDEVKSYSTFAENSGVTFEENIADNIFTDCNAQLMKMAIDNYLSNAVKYSVGDKTVQVNLFERNGSFTLAVINAADETDVKNAQESWDEFSRGDKARSRQGRSIGMGLPICKKIFELHGFKGYCKYGEGRVSFVITGS